MTQRQQAPPDSIQQFVPFFKAFCHPTRASIVELLLAGERCVCELTAALELSQPLISHHLAILRETGFVAMRSEGTRTYYRVDWPRFDSSTAAFAAFVARLRDSHAGAPDTATCTRQAREKLPAR